MHKKRPLKVAIVVGTRPEAIKMAPVYISLKSDHRIDTCFIASAQHRQMLDKALSIFDITPDIDLNLMQPDQSLGDLSARLIIQVQSALQTYKPDVVLVHGDTATCLFSALAAFYEQIPIGHVEAGLRTYNFNAPWPEEMNRRLTDPLCTWCFAPTRKAAKNLKDENIPEAQIFITGNTVIDALFLALDKIRNKRIEIEGLNNYSIDGKRLILVTGHRRESFGLPFEQFCLALKDISNNFPDVAIVYPVHLNPNVQKPVREILGSEKSIHLIEPIEYLPFISLMDRSDIIITDSGGIQEEGPSIHKPVLVTRETTERPEAVEAGLAKLVGTSRDKIVSEASELLSNPKKYKSMSTGKNPYGDGNASSRILDILISHHEKHCD